MMCVFEGCKIIKLRKEGVMEVQDFGSDPNQDEIIRHSHVDKIQLLLIERAAM